MKITADMLKAKDACDHDVDKFRDLWPDGCTPSLRVALKAAHNDLCLYFFAEHFLSAPARKAYYDACAPAEKAYDDAYVTAQKAYDDACVTAEKAYYDTRATTWKALNDACVPAWETYYDAYDIARKALNDSKAKALWEAWKMDHTRATAKGAK